MTSGSVDDLLETASARTGLTDFGVPSFREGLEVLLMALEREARLTEAGRSRFDVMILGRLVNRLELQHWRRRNPEIADRSIEAPWFTVGCWRSSTTALSYLLAQDPANRSLRRWEAARPCPPPGVDAAADRVRREQMRESLLAQDEAAPEIRKMNLQEAGGPVECVLTLSHEFKGPLWDTFAHVPSYGAYNRSVDYASAYAYHRQTLELLQWRDPVPERWQLKAPSHLLALDALLAQYPDACLIFTHRDPLQSLASACSFWEALTAMGSRSIDPKEIGAEWVQMFDRALTNAVEFRQRHPEVPCVDVQHAEMVMDPVGTVARIYGAFGAELSEAAEERMRSFAGDHSHGRHGRHHYSAERYGLDAEALRDRYREYMERFGVAEEGSDG